MKNLKLNNGQTATYTHTDFWSRPCYTLENGVAVCCINLDGTYLHTYDKDWEEPQFPVKKEYQPVDSDDIVHTPCKDKALKLNR